MHCIQIIMNWDSWARPPPDTKRNRICACDSTRGDKPKQSACSPGRKPIRNVFNSSANGEKIMENMPDHLLSKDQYLAKKLELLNLEVERLSLLYPEESPVVTGQNETPGSQLDWAG